MVTRDPVSLVPRRVCIKTKACGPRLSRLCSRAGLNKGPLWDESGESRSRGGCRETRGEVLVSGRHDQSGKGYMA